MKTFTQSRGMQMCAVLALAAITIFVARPVTAAYNQGNEQRSMQDQSQGEDSSAAGAARNLQLERRIASRLRSQGYGQAGQIMILAMGNRVILLGNVPDDETKDGVERITKQVAAGTRVDDRLHVVSQPQQMSDTQLQAKVADKLPGDTAKTIDVQAQNGTVLLRGHLDNWTQAADVIDAAFAAGAQRVSSQLTIGAGATAQAGGAAGGYYPPYGYAPGQPGYGAGSQGVMGTPGGQASTSDLRLAQRVAQQLQQQLPPGHNVQTIQPQSIYVAVQNGMVTLHGFVQNTSQIQQAEQIARSVQGVQNVNNDLAIFSGRGGMGEQGQYGQAGQGMTGQQTATSDRRLAQTIQQHLRNQFPDANISVRASQGTVILQGSVADSNQKQQAEQFAYSIPGVQNVQNNLTVGEQGGTTGQSGYYPPQGYVPGQQSQQETGNQSGMSSQSGQQAMMSPSDTALAHQVAQKLQQQLQGIRDVQVVKPGTIYVSVRQGTVVLDGLIQNRDVPLQAIQIARAIPGVRNVQSMLQIAGGGFAPTYGYVPGQAPQGQTGQPGAGTSGQGANTGQNAGAAQFSQTAYGNQSNMGARNTAGAGSMGAPSLPPMGTSPSDTALAWQVAQKLQQQLPNHWVQVIRPDTIYVTANQGTVMLYGFVKDPSVKQHASQIAQSVSGVQHVRDSLGIAGAGAPSTLGYIPGQENQSENQQYENEESDADEDEEFVIIEPGDDSESDTGTY
jgi:osmotically-inducible protein OsmY